MAIRIGIYGYGNLGRGIETALAHAPDMTLAAIFTRREPGTLKTAGTAPVYAASAAEQYRDAIDVMIVCGGSATDLPKMTPMLARQFNVVDSFDTHASIPAHFAAVDEAARQGGHTAVICAGWDPGLFSVNRIYADAILPDGETYTFWGKGVSQGHSDALRRIDGVLDARQYTVPVEAALDAVRHGKRPTLTPRQKHTRECYVVAAPDADRARIEREIKTMPHYFDEYDTTVHFITQEELNRDHRAMPHGGFVIRSGHTGAEHTQVIEYRLQLASNPEFTAGVLVACARAAWRLNGEKALGAKTMADLPPSYLSPLDGATLREKYL